MADKKTDSVKMDFSDLSDQDPSEMCWMTPEIEDEIVESNKLYDEEQKVKLKTLFEERKNVEEQNRLMKRDALELLDNQLKEIHKTEDTSGGMRYTSGGDDNRIPNIRSYFHVLNKGEFVICKLEENNENSVTTVFITNHSRYYINHVRTAFNNIKWLSLHYGMLDSIIPEDCYPIIKDTTSGNFLQTLKIIQGITQTEAVGKWSALFARLSDFGKKSFPEMYKTYVKEM